MNTTRLARFSSGQDFKLDRRMGEMLHVLDHDRPAAARDIEQTLDAQQVGAAQRVNVSIARENVSHSIGSGVR